MIGSDKYHIQVDQEFDDTMGVTNLAVHFGNG